METIKVAIVGATGVTGTSIVNGLVASDAAHFEITALIRPASLQKPGVAELEKKGVRIVAADLSGPQNELVTLVKGTDVVISAIFAGELGVEKQLADAVKAAGVKRFVPCFFAPVIPPKGVMLLRDIKEDSLNYIKKIRLGYTVIDIGWWYQLFIPQVPSGRTDYVMMARKFMQAGEGDVPVALTDHRDIGKIVAKIIADPRTLNRMVLGYSKLWTQAEALELMDKLSGEESIRTTVSIKEIQDAAEVSSNKSQWYKHATFQYLNSWGVRGDNTPENAKYLGYLVANELYPELEAQMRPLDEYYQEVLDGKSEAPYKALPTIKS